MPSPPLSIVQSLSPRIAVLASEDVLDSCALNGCQGLEELLRPWEGGTERVSILSSTLTPTIHPTFPLRFVSHASVYTHPSQVTPNPDLVVDMVGSLVGSKRPEDEQHYALTRSLVLSSRPVTPHETFNHPVGVLLAVSTSTPDPLDTLTKMYGQAVSVGAQSAPWLDGVQVMRFFVVVHDIGKAGEDLAPAYELLAMVKKAYGPHSTLLVINSLPQDSSNSLPSPNITMHPSIPLPRPPSALDSDSDPTSLSQVYASALSSLTLTPGVASAAVADDTDPSPSSLAARKKLYASRLDAEDAQRLVALVRELVVQSLVPWMEARVREWNEVYHANRRGITGRLFGAGRKLFGASRPNSPQPGSQAGFNAVKGFYPVNSVEALSRRLADFAFMLRDYKYAGSIYDSLRRDFAQDRAWRYASAATEMYGLSLLLSHTYFLPSSPPTLSPIPFTTLQHTDISSWLEQAVVSYQQRAPASQIQLDALRITVLYYEAWKAINEWRGVGAALVKAAGEADEVPSAVMIEEAAAADVKGGKSTRGRRRQAFHLTMAARRYETAGLKTFSRRCLDRASELVRTAAWTAARDRIEYSLGRQAYTLGESDVAVEHFLRLLQREDTGAPGSQGMVLEDMALAYEQLVARPDLLESAKDKLVLPTPVFDVTKTRIVLASEASTSGSSSDRWAELNSQALATWDRKGKKPMSLLPDDKRTITGVGETLHVELVATNPLNSPVVLSDLTLVVDPSSSVQIETIPSTPLEPYETRSILLSVTATQPCDFSFTHASFLFHRFFPCLQSLARRGRRLHATKAQRLTPTYAKDSSRDVTVQSDRPRVGIEVVGVPGRVRVGEKVYAEVRVKNLGNMEVENVQLVMSEQGIVRLRSGTDEKITGSTHSLSNRIPGNSPLVIYPGSIAPGEDIIVPITFTSFTPGPLDLLSLAIFSATSNPDILGSTPLSIYIDVVPALQVSAAVKPGRDGNYLVFLEAFNASDEVLDVLGATATSEIWSTIGGNHLSGKLLPNQTLRDVFTVTPCAEYSTTSILQTRLVSDLGALVRGLPESVKGVPSDEVVTVTLGTVGSAGDLGSDWIHGFTTSRRLYKLRQATVDFPTLQGEMVAKIFPLIDPLDLDFAVSWSIATDPDSAATTRSGQSFVHSIRLAPETSLVEPLRAQLAAVSETAKRTMYEETGRIQRALEDSVLSGVIAKEEDPVGVAVQVEGGKGGKVDVALDGGRKGVNLGVKMMIRNRSLVRTTRWVLSLPQPSMTRAAEGPYGGALATLATFAGRLDYRGTLKPGEVGEVDAEIWVTKEGSVSLAGWVLQFETGEEVGPEEGAGEQDESRAGKVWIPRMSWSRVGTGPVVDIRDTDK